jgi:hypothetical protein
MSESSWSSLGSDWGPNLEDRSPRASEPGSKKAHVDAAYSFLLRFALMAAIFLLALLMSYLEH